MHSPDLRYGEDSGDGNRTSLNGRLSIRSCATHPTYTYTYTYTYTHDARVISVRASLWPYKNVGVTGSRASLFGLPGMEFF
ncbi:hypothetical protein FRY77_05350 [Halomonas sp. MG34]|nr:hypothetical protein [Halomonas sp. MG34]